jgi:hypothetical protein
MGTEQEQEQNFIAIKNLRGYLTKLILLFMGVCVNQVEV